MTEPNKPPAVFKVGGIAEVKKDKEENVDDTGSIDDTDIDDYRNRLLALFDDDDYDDPIADSDLCPKGTQSYPRVVSMLQQRELFPLRQQNTIVEFIQKYLQHGADADAVDVDDDNDEDDSIVNLAPAERDNICNAVMSVIQQEQQKLQPWPRTFRSFTLNKMEVFANQLLHTLNVDIYNMINDRRTAEEGFNGLDDTRDTEDQVETAIRFHPEALVVSERAIFGDYSIPKLNVPAFVRTNIPDRENDADYAVCNVKAVTFVPLFVRLAIELNSFGEATRGGLLTKCYGKNILQRLLYSSDANSPYNTIQHHQTVDNVFLSVLERLRRSGYFQRDDIRKFHLVPELCSHKEYFAEKRFRFLVEWCPESLLSFHRDHMPLHYAAKAAGIRQFEVTFDALIRFFPRWKGLLALHRKYYFERTPYRELCYKFNATQKVNGVMKVVENKVMNIIQDTLRRYNITTPLDINTALLLAATDETIHLDCVYFLTRNDPQSVLNMLHHNYSSRVAYDNFNDDNQITDKEDDGVDDDHNDKNDKRSRKRFRT